MFTRKPDAAVGGGPVVVSIIGPDLVVTGNLETTGDLQVDGGVEGDISAARIVIGEHARVIGDLVANEIVIGGNVRGSIRGNTVTFQGGCHVEGDVLHRKLTIEQGAYFEGRSRRSEDPTGRYRNGGAPR
ncbi:MAG: polymer-forming cytoskeletal protein [Hyphomicrobiaceae bacterium]|nr:polymer-forming cytoskeletal protein [Hyphomicrobiaceae bacterium]